MSARVHVHLKVADLDASRRFYEKFFGAPAVKEKADQVKFLPGVVPLNLALSPARSPRTDAPAVNHLGIEVESSDEVMRHLVRVKAAGLAVREQLNVNCCYANQCKFWVIDPDGVEWELYHVNFETEEKHGGRIETPAARPATAIATISADACCSNRPRIA